MAMKYRKKPVVVEAVQWTGNNHADMCEFIDPEVFEIIPRVGLVIHTLEGDHHASPGDYIIKGVNGEFYPCKPDIFAKTYESATLTPPTEWVSVEERLPENDGWYLVYAPGYWGNSQIYGLDGLAYSNFKHNYKVHWGIERGTGRGWPGIVTHWMELPAPPGKDNNVPTKAPNEPLSI